MSEGAIFLAYVRVTFMLFFITFFVNIFVQYFRSGVITPRKIFTYKAGGLFEHYKIVGIIMFTLLMIHGIFNINPMATGEESNWLSFSIEFLLMYIPLVIFTGFFFIFLFFLLLYGVARIKKVEQPAVFIQTKSRLVINLALALALVLVTLIMSLLLVGALR